ncbi:hypothetical protein AB833_12250 [Chromatiales bacterium (ex Bugula neritina AB1)]|nr:hypothetical protein AB833_12250 [Chromatiales bacterium (ex Bugula neritina AB1)]
MSRYWVLVGVLLAVLTSCSAAQLYHGRVAYDRAPYPEPVANETADIHWRIIGNYTPLSMNRVPPEWIGNAAELLSKDAISLLSEERRDFAKVSIQANALESSRLTADKLHTEISSIHLHYRAVIDNFAYGASGHTHLTPLFKMKSIDQWRNYVPADPYVPATIFPVLASVEGLSGSCLWQVNNTQFRNNCESIVFAAPSGSQSLTVRDNNGKMKQVAVNPAQITLLALGDGSIAGEGIFDDHWHDPQCHRSSYSWPFLVAGRLAATNGQTQYNVLNRACAGAGFTQVLQASYTGVEQPELTVGAKSLAVPNKDRPPQLKAAIQDLCGYSDQACSETHVQPDYIFVSIGAADLQFGETVAQALDRSSDNMPANLRSQSELESALNNLLNNYRTLAERLRQHFPQAKVLMTNYLDPLHQRGDKLCGDDSAPSDPDQSSPGVLPTLFSPIRNLLALTDDDSQTRQLQQQFVRPALEGIAAIGKTLERENQGYWYFVPTAGYQESGNQTTGLETRGFCNRGVGVNGPWFNRIERGLSNNSVVASNIFGQLQISAKVFDKMCTLDDRVDCNTAE